LIGGFGSLLGLIVFLLVVAPMLIGTGAGTGYALSIVNNRIAGKVQVTDLQLGWFSGQKIDGLTILDPDAQPVVMIDSIDAPDLSIWGLLTSGLDLGQVTVTHPVVDLKHSEDGTSNLSRAFAPADSPAKSPDDRESTADENLQDAPESLGFPADLRAKLSLVDGRVTYHSAGIDEVQIRDLSITFDALDPRNISVSVRADVNQLGHHGQVRANATITDLVDAQGNLKTDQAKVEAQVDLTDLPVTALDRLAQQDGSLEALLGPVLNLQMTAKGGLSRFDSRLSAQAENLNLRFDVRRDDQGFQVDPSSKLRLTVQSNAWDTLTASPNAHAAVKLAAPFDVTARVSDFRISGTENDTPNAPSQAVAEVTLNVGDIALDFSDQRINRVAITGTSLNLGLDRVKKTVRAELTSTVNKGLDQIPIKLQAIDHTVMDEHGHFNLEKLDTELQARIGPVPVELLDLLTEMNGLIQTTLGPEVSLAVNSKVQIDPTTRSILSNYDLIVQSENFQAELDGSIADERLAINPGGEIKLLIDPAILPLVLSRYGTTLSEPYRGLRLDHPIRLRLESGSIKVPLKDFDPKDIEAGFKLSLDRVAPGGLPMLENVSLNNIELEVTGARLGGSVPVELRAKIGHAQRDATVSAHATASALFTGPVQLRGDLSVEGLPSSLMDQLIGQKEMIQTYLDPTLDKITVAYAINGPDLTLNDVRVESKKLSADLGAQYLGEKQVLSLRDNSRVTYQLTPRVWADLLTRQTEAGSEDPKSSDVIAELVDPVNILLEIGGSQLALAPKPQAATESHPAKTDETFRINADASSIKAKITFSPIILRQTGITETARVDQLLISVLGEDLRRLISVDVHGDCSLDQDGQPGSSTGKIISNTRIVGLFNTDGAMDLDHFTTQTDTRVQELPVALVDAWLSMSGQAAEILGPTLSITLEGGYSKANPNPVKLTMDSANAQARMTAEVGQTLRLLEPATVDLVISAALSERWLASINPLLNEAVSSDKPIKLVLKPDGLEVPLSDFSMDKLRADISLDLGTMKFKDDGLVNSLWGFLKRNPTQPRVATFTPLNVHIDNNVISYRDMTMAIDKLKIGFQGKINQTNRKVDLTMSIDGETMANAFSLQNVIEPGYTFDIPLRGTISEPKLDLGAITKEVGRLVAKSEIKKGLGGPGADAAGAALDLLFGGKKENTNKPPGNTTEKETAETNPQDSQQGQSPTDQNKDDPPPEKKPDPPKKRLLRDLLNGL
jgi:hypothetical protein